MVDNFFYRLLTENFESRVKGERKKLGLTQDQLAKKVGVSKTTIQNYEAGSIPKGRYLFALSRALKCSIDWLLVFEESPYIKENYILEDPSGMTKKELAEYHDEMRGGKSPIYKGREGPDLAHVKDPNVKYKNQEDPETADLLTMTREIIKSKTDYSASLAANIRSFHHAIKTEARLNKIEEKVLKMENKIKHADHIRKDDAESEKGKILKKRVM